MKKWNRAWKLQLIESLPTGRICGMGLFECSETNWLDSRFRWNDIRRELSSTVELLMNIASRDRFFSVSK
jgi:hypothetical protein